MTSFLQAKTRIFSYSSYVSCSSVTLSLMYMWPHKNIFCVCHVLSLHASSLLFSLLSLSICYCTVWPAWHIWPNQLPHFCSQSPEAQLWLWALIHTSKAQKSHFKIKSGISILCDDIQGCTNLKCLTAIYFGGKKRMKRPTAEENLWKVQEKDKKCFLLINYRQIYDGLWCKAVLKSKWINTHSLLRRNPVQSSVIYVLYINEGPWHKKTV